MAIQYNEMQQIKRHFFTLRNGAIGDMMRKRGANYKIIFGLNLPQLDEIAKLTPKNSTLSQKLWENKSTRESMLLAPMIHPLEEFSIEKALLWINEIPTTEVADILCHRLLRHTPYAQELARKIASSCNEMTRYTALRLLFNLLPEGIDYTLEIATLETTHKCALTHTISQQLIDEISFLKEQP